MGREKLDRELQRVVDRVLPLTSTGLAISKEKFEVILGEIMSCVDEKTGAGVERIGQVKAKVLADLPNEYGRLDARERSWQALIAYLYTKFLRELSAA